MHVAPDEEAAARGVTLVDADGAPVAADRPVGDGAELYFSVPVNAGPGTASLTATATSGVAVGRAFTGVDTPTQTMILAASAATPLGGAASAAWAGPGLPSVAVNAARRCAEGGVEVTASNSGGAPFRLALGGREAEVAPGSAESVLVPVAEGRAYEITVAHPAEGREPWVFTGVLDCSPADQPGNALAPASAGGAAGTAGDADLAATGGDPLPLAALALLGAGAAALHLVRRRTAPAVPGASEAPGGTPATQA
ncbi:hypothetical protein RM780_05485 [Streptomyces sp. DSM 44917]|uniref:Gram-positive cocci surface proteins LPxTG domain-containing protein n=1 Tax=Streptomyces boetiae TaxID=3075541 RepID=A0ABU2L5A3_9ACTN|nr:hypothetical protein [Streptomyces sp. DSM 44917]MDT0306413.1 hypothetical protein [Streptomyces sp. DSM 44917]